MLLTLTGGAAAGKTTLAAALVETFAPRAVSVLHIDDYYFATTSDGVWVADQDGVPRLDVGDPRSVDFARLETALGGLPPDAVVVIEGMFAQRVGPRTGAGRLDVFVDVPADIRLARKIERQCVNGSVPLKVLLHNYIQFRRRAHETYVEPARHRCDLIVDGTRPVTELAALIRTALTARLPSNRTASVGLSRDEDPATPRT